MKEGFSVSLARTTDAQNAIDNPSPVIYKIARRVNKVELRRLLGIDTRYELDGFLKAHGVWMDYAVDDLRRDVATLQRLGF